MRYWICAAALCALAAPAAADARAHASGRGAARLALADAPAVTPAPGSGGVVAPLPRGNPGDPLDRERLERADAETRGSAAAEARSSDREAKGGAQAGDAAARDTEAK